MQISNFALIPVYTSQALAFDARAHGQTCGQLVKHFPKQSYDINDKLYFDVFKEINAHLSQPSSPEKKDTVTTSFDFSALQMSTPAFLSQRHSAKKKYALVIAYDSFVREMSDALTSIEPYHRSLRMKLESSKEEKLLLDHDWGDKVLGIKSQSEPLVAKLMVLELDLRHRPIEADLKNLMSKMDLVLMKWDDRNKYAWFLHPLALRKERPQTELLPCIRTHEGFKRFCSRVKVTRQLLGEWWLQVGILMAKIPEEEEFENLVGMMSNLFLDVLKLCLQIPKEHELGELGKLSPEKLMSGLSSIVWT